MISSLHAAPPGLQPGSVFGTTTNTTITLTWPIGSYTIVEIVYSDASLGVTPSPSVTNEGETSFTLMGLDPGRNYSITLTALTCPGASGVDIDCPGEVVFDCGASGARGTPVAVLYATCKYYLLSKE